MSQSGLPVNYTHLAIYVPNTIASLRVAFRVAFRHNRVTYNTLFRVHLSTLVRPKKATV
jgi:hypothetical protein